ncbi:hypothetical protein GG344DRAFT_81073 [Lentinula edodes]|nr:hypothetical protein GG344DRAFT_81073 [Lentinula edodes]
MLQTTLIDVTALFSRRGRTTRKNCSIGLLRVLYLLNTLEAESTLFGGEKRSMKLTCQLEETMILASSCLPDRGLNILSSSFPSLHNNISSNPHLSDMLAWQLQQAIRSQGTVRVAELVLGEEVPLTIETLKLVNNNLANSLTKLPTIAPADKQPPLNDELALIEETITVEAPALDLTLPGYDIELKPSEKESL